MFECFGKEVLIDGQREMQRVNTGRREKGQWIPTLEFMEVERKTLVAPTGGGKRLWTRRAFCCFGFKAGIFWKKIGEVMIGVHLITLKWFNYGKIVCWCVFGDLGVVKIGPHPSLHLWLLPGFCEEFASANWEPFKECWGRPTRYAWIWGSSKWTNCWDARRKASRTNRSSDEIWWQRWQKVWK